MAFFKNISSNVARAKHSALVAIGQSQSTVDEEFDQLAAQFKESYSKLKQLGKFIVNYQNGIKDLGAAQQGMAPMILEQYDASDRMYPIANQYKDQISSRVVDLGKSLDANLGEDFHRPLTMYLEQYKSIEERIEERNRRLVDMDRYTDDYRSLQGKADIEPTRLQIAKEKSEYKTKAYVDLNTELKRDIPLLIQGKTRVLDALFATFIQLQAQHLQDVAGGLKSFQPYFEGISNAPPSNWPFVITDPAASAMNPENARNAPAQRSQPAASAQRSQPAPPPAAVPPRPKPAQVTARALYPFQGQDHTELTFQPNDVIVVVRQGGDWWEGELGGRRGLFPANYVTLM